MGPGRMETPPAPSPHPVARLVGGRPRKPPPLIERYTLQEMGRVWSEEAKFRSWLDVEIAATEA